MPSKRKAMNGIWGLAQTWDLDGVTTSIDLNYEYTAGFAPNSNVEYIFKIINANNELTERFAMFDAGTSPWEKDKILLYSTTRKPLSQTINVCFFPDIDFKSDWQNFLNQTEDLIYEGYHANNMITDHKGMWNFYYTRQEADGYEMLINPGNETSYPEFMRDGMIAGIDAYGLLHVDEYPDRTYFRSSFNFLGNNVFTTEVYNYGTAVHETAHAVFRLSDEYDGCACFQSELGSNVFMNEEGCTAFNEKYNLSNPECNVLLGYNDQPWYMSEKKVLFRTEQECQDFNIANGFSRDSCQIFLDSNGNWFRAFKGVCIMQDDGDRRPNPFQRTCQIVINNYYDALDQLVTENDAFTIPPTILIPNMFGYEAVVLVELMQKENAEYDMKVVDIQYGIPSKNVLNGRGLDITFESKNGEMMHQVSLDNPSHVLFHNEKGSAMEDLGHGSCVVAIPFNKNLSKATLDVQKLSSRENITIKGISEKSHKEFSIAQKVQACYAQFLNEK